MYIAYKIRQKYKENKENFFKRISLQGREMLKEFLAIKLNC